MTKNMTKTRWILCAVLAVVLILALSAVLWLYRFNTYAIQKPLNAAGIMQFKEGAYRQYKISFDCTERTGLLLSDMYAFETETQMQLRFRCLYSVPFAGEDIFAQTALYLTNEAGDDLSPCISAYSDRFTGFNGVNIQLNFFGETRPRSGEKLVLTITSREAGEEPYAACKILLTVP
ncbi:MAG: hypothetical protein J6R77_07770 [Clostridia bacterium]|nr:hypothetical protein [Clostridia bacterium]